MRRVPAVVAVLGLLVAGCGSDDDAATPDDETPAATATAEPAVAESPEAEAEPDPTEAAPTETPAPPVVELPGVSTIAIESTTGSVQPELTWPAVNDATWYQLIVLDSAGNAYWAWGGPETSVVFGGGNGGEPGQTAVVFESMTWSVAAFDAGGTLIGLSDPATLTP